MPFRPLGRTALRVPPLGFGAFKIGRNQGIKYTTGYELPDDAAVSQLLNGVLDLGCTLIDTAPAYGLSEERIGRAIGHRRGEFILSTKVGETFDDGVSRYDFTRTGVERSLQRSLQRLQTDVLDLVFIHSNGDDLHVLSETDVVPVLHEWRDRGAIRAIGLSGKTVEGARAALSWADAVMVEYHLDDTSHAEVIAAAAAQGIGVFVKKGLASGRLPAAEAIRFVVGTPGVSSLIVGGLSLDHFAANWQTATTADATR
ncbi:MAG TPA: aldo/keto reductase [Planctomycetaceae bacterium]|nr:aldo/keto reductase [Planctomycetaceae bacterium]